MKNINEWEQMGLMDVDGDGKVDVVDALIEQDVMISAMEEEKKRNMPKRPRSFRDKVWIWVMTIQVIILLVEIIYFLAIIK